MDKMIKTAKNLHLMAKAAQWICLIAAILLPPAAFALRLMPKHLFAGYGYYLNVGNFNLELCLDGVAPAEETRKSLIIGLLFAALILFLAWLTLRIIVRMLEPMTQGRPFTREVSDSLNRLSWIALIGGGIYEIGSVVIQAIQYSGINLYMLFDSAAIGSFTVEFRIDCWFLLLFLLLRLMSYVFRYGEALQQLSDETL